MYSPLQTSLVAGIIFYILVFQSVFFFCKLFKIILTFYSSPANDFSFRLQSICYSFTVQNCSIQLKHWHVRCDPVTELAPEVRIIFEYQCLQQKQGVNRQLDSANCSVEFQLDTMYNDYVEIGGVNLQLRMLSSQLSW